jgi:hypothetical protein
MTVGKVHMQMIRSTVTSTSVRPGSEFHFKVSSIGLFCLAQLRL